MTLYNSGAPLMLYFLLVELGSTTHMVTHGAPENDPGH